MKKNKGYTLIEMLIVIAIMAVLTGLAAVSISLIQKGKQRDAISVFESQLNNVWLQTKSIGVSETSMYMVIERDGSKGAYKIQLYDMIGGSPVLKEETTMNKYVNLSYNSEGVANQEQGGYGDAQNKWYIKFNKATGAVERGAGLYYFKDLNGEVVATYRLDAVTGKHLRE